ncbi:hypothetical protein [Dissulfurispira thermophila]|nr:hypothetical protein [Dissulfurispira thermophila]
MENGKWKMEDGKWSFSLRPFTFAMTFAAVSIIGLLGKIFRLF